MVKGVSIWLIGNTTVARNRVEKVIKNGLMSRAIAMHARLESW